MLFQFNLGCMDIVGHSKQRAFLNSFLERNLFFSVFLFWGPEQTGKFFIAQHYAKSFLCLNKVFGGCGSCLSCSEMRRTGKARDLFLFSEEQARFYQEKNTDDNLYGVWGIDQMIDFLSTKPILADRRVVIIDNAHLLSSEAQNKLLKTLEEPMGYAHIILVSHRPDQLLETIRSRSLSLSFGLVSTKELFFWVKQKIQDEKTAQLIAKYSCGRPGKARQFIEKKKLIQEFQQLVLMLLSIEKESIASRIITASKLPKFSFSPYEIWQIWQLVIRDELLLQFGLHNKLLLLTKPRTTTHWSKKVAFLRESLDLSELLETSLSPRTLTNSFEYLALKL